MNGVRLAGYSAVGAAIAMPLSAVALWLFFAGAGAFYGPVNDILIALALVLLAPAVLAYRRLATRPVGGWLTVMTVIGLIGIALAAIGQVLLVVGVINLESSFVTFGVGALGFLTWGASLAYLALRTDSVSTAVGWLFVALIASAVAGSLLALVPSSIAVLASGIGVALTLEAWLISLALDLFRRRAS